MTWVAEPQSPLGWAPCRVCATGMALVVEAWAGRALCGPCLAEIAGVKPHASIPITPVVGTSIGAGPGAPNMGESNPYPPCEVSSRQRCSQALQTPSPVLGLERFAQSHGWQTVTTYARGHKMHSGTGRALGVVDSWAVRFGGHPETGRRAVAVHMGGSWNSMLIWGPDLPFFSHLSITDLKQFLSTIAIRQGSVMQKWLLSIRQGLENRAQVNKVKARARAISGKTRKVKESGG